MRTIEEIKADIENSRECDKILEGVGLIGLCPKGTCQFCDLYTSGGTTDLKLELYETLTADIPLDRLAEICNAEREGRCVVLPCKVGDTVYFIENGRPYNVGVTSIEISSKGIALYLYGMWKRITPQDFGKTVFLTHPEAEAKLKEDTP
jgi:hypothetical protein